MSIPEWFEEQLERRFQGRFRLRWSEIEHVFMLEQKVRRAVAEGFAPRAFKSERHRKLTMENYIRARDGYILSMKISPTTRAYCQRCDTRLDMPAMQTAQVTCPVCMSHGHRTVTMGGYWPLNDALLHELERTDPDRGGNERVFAAQQAAEQYRELSAELAITRPADAAFRERYRRLVGIPQVGLSGKTASWTDAPVSKPTWGKKE